MKKLIALGLLFGCFVGFGADAAVRSSTTLRRVPATTNSTTNATDVANTSSGGLVMPARLAVRRSGTVATNTGLGSQKSGAVSARAATTKKVISSGTQIAGATTNTIVSEECRTKYFGCMDSFCMLDNVNGGRCLCSNRHMELDTVLEEIQKLDEQSYAMATVGVDRINMGADADAVQKMVDSAANAAAQSATSNAKRTRSLNLDLDAWNDVYEDIDDFAAEDSISNKTGDALYSSASSMCAAQIPGCRASMSMLKLMYAQQIKSDCTAYENSLKQQRNSSMKKLQTAQTAMRDAALEQYQNANKYDLGQCTIRFKQCMQTTAGCGDDFSKCASSVAMQNLQSNKKNKTVKTGATNISIAAGTYDVLMAKKTMCESVTKQCVAVKDKVWDTFLVEAAPEIKSAELIAESNLRMNCISDISSCFQSACKDNMDPNNPDGSYDMCLSRPETMRALCSVQIEPCIAAEPKILDYVYARLASMRVDACTTEVKNCLTDEDRCGSDYSKCIGLDLQSVRDMCPLAKLIACQENGQDATWDVIDNIVQGVYLDIDNSLLTNCQNAVNAKYIEICGDDIACAAFDDDTTMGADSLTSYKARDGSFVIEGLVTFGNVKIKETASTSDDVKFGKYELDIENYSDNIQNVDGTSVIKGRVLSTLQSTQNKINQKIALLTSDPKISMCVNGRDMSQIRGANSKRSETRDTARYPHLLDSAIMSIVNAGLDKATENYSKKYNELVAGALEQQSDEIKAALCAAMATDVPDVDNGKSDVFVEAPTIGSVLQNFKKATGLTVSPVVTLDNNFSGMRESKARPGVYDVRLIIDGMTMNELLNQQKSGRGEFVQVDTFGNMIGKIVMNAVYSSDTDTCKLTSYTTMCENMKDVYNTVDENGSSGGIGFGGSSWFIGIGGHSGGGVVKNYTGNVCTRMAQPVVTSQDIPM